MKRKIIYFVFVILVLIGIYYYSGWFPIVTIDENTEIIHTNNEEENQLIHSLKKIDFKENSIAYLIISNDDFDKLPNKLVQAKTLYCDDHDALMKLKKHFVFKKTSGDLATCESRLVIFNGDTKIFQSSVVIEENLIGIQNNVTGWSEAKYRDELISVFSSFKQSRCLFLKI